MHKCLLLFISLIFVSSEFSRAGDNSAYTIDTSRFKDKAPLYIGKKPLKNLYIGGTYHGYLYYRDVDKLFDGTYSQERVKLGNNGTQQLQMDISGRPTQNTYFQSNMYLYNDMRGLGYDTTGMNVVYGINLDGQTKTDFANFQYRFGGIQYTKLSKLTLWTNENNGESLFEKNPWEGCIKAGSNYESYYSQGTILRDFRWGNQPVQGVTMSMTEMPVKGLEAKFLYGKTPSNGGQTSYLKTIPDISYGGLVGKYFGKNYIGINSFNGLTYNDSINGKVTGYNVISTNFSYEFRSLFLFSGELAKGYNKESTTMTQNEGEAVDVNILSYKKASFIPLNLHMYYLGSKFVSTNGGFNSFTTTTTGFNGLEASSNPVGAYMSDVDYINGNRRGVDLRTELNVSGLKINLANGVSEEVNHLTNKISFGHRISSVVFSNIYQYQTNAGPYGTMTTGFKSYYETIGLDTTNPDYPTSRFKFNVVECNLKYKINVNNKSMYFFYLGSYSSVQDKLSAIPVFSDEAYFRANYNEFEVYYNIHPNVALASYFGYERVVGNHLTTKSSTTGKYYNQYGKSVGLGVDFQFGDFVNLYVRTRWFNYKDKSFVQNQYNGYEASMDMRVYF